MNIFKTLFLLTVTSLVFISCKKLESKGEIIWKLKTTEVNKFENDILKVSTVKTSEEDNIISEFKNNGTFKEIKDTLGLGKYTIVGSNLTANISGQTFNFVIKSITSDDLILYQETLSTAIVENREVKKKDTITKIYKSN